MGKKDRTCRTCGKPSWGRYCKECTGKKKYTNVYRWRKAREKKSAVVEEIAPNEIAVFETRYESLGKERI